MENLTTFLLGIVFVMIGMPFLHSIADIIATIGEAIKAKLAISIAKSDKEISETSSVGSCAIGFQYEPQEEDFEDEEESLD